MRIHAFCLSVPYSNAGYVQLFRGKNAECIVHGLVDRFQHLGGVPRRLTLDNASGVGRRIGERVRMTALFARFQAHSGFETTFCNPYAGHEKGYGWLAVMRSRTFKPLPRPDVTEGHSP